MNAYPNDENYEVPSFVPAVEPPQIDPDEGVLISVAYSPEWTAVLEGALTQLRQYAAWVGTSDEKILAVNRANMLMDMLQADISSVPIPYWDESNGDDSDDQQPSSIQEWYGYMEGANFVDTAAGWVFTGFVAATYGIEGAVQFATFLHNIRLFFRTADAGSIVRVVVNEVLGLEVDTYSHEPGLLAVDLAIPYESASLRALDPPAAAVMQIINTGTANPLATPNADGEFLMQIVRKELIENEGVPRNLRYRFDDYNFNGVEITLDGGATWTFTSEQDTRYGSSYLYAPVGDDKCNAAYRCTARIKEQVDIFTETLEMLQYVALIITVIDKFMLETGFFIELITDVVGGVAALGEAAINASFTEEQYDLIRCAIFCHIADDGSLNSDQVWATWTQINDTCNTTVSTVIYAFWWIWGDVGWNNMAQTGSETGDCDDCATCDWCKNLNFADSDYDFAPMAANKGFWQSSSGWWSTAVGNPINAQYLEIQREFDPPTVLKTAKITYGSHVYLTSGSGAWLEVETSTGTVTNLTGIINQNGDPIYLNWSGNLSDIKYFRLRIQYNGGGNVQPPPHTAAYFLDISGEGDDPFPDGQDCT